MTSTSNGTSPAAIFARLWETKNGRLPRTLARTVLKLGFSEQDKSRMHELAQKNAAGRISRDEIQELDNYISAGDFLALLQSKARRSLRKARVGPTHHG